MSFINLSGLTIGFCSCLLIGVYILHEVRYDDFESNSKRIVRVIMGYKFNGGGEEKKGNFTSARVAPVFKRTFPEITDAVRMIMFPNVVQYGDKMINEQRFMYADPSFFKIFSFKIVEGSKQPLQSANQVVLTKSTAQKYFNLVDPIGKTLAVGENKQLYQIVGVVEDCPSNSQIKFDFLASFSSLGLAANESSYWDADYTTFFLLKDAASINTLQAKISPFTKKEMTGQGASVNFYLEPFKSIHLYSQYDGFEPNNNIRYIYTLEAIALMILLIACFTYINLNTARSLERAKEVGIRKVIGAGKHQLFWQFIGESAILCLLGMTVSFAIASVTLPVFDQLINKSLPADSLFTATIIPLAFVVTVTVSLFAGSYPALVIANFRPITVLKGSFKHTASGKWLRQTLVVIQFTVAVVLIVATAIMHMQLRYIQSKNTGYNRQQVLILPMDQRMAQQLALIKQQFKADINVISVSACRSSPVNIAGGYTMRSAVMPENQQMTVAADPIDEDFIKTTGLQIIAGSDLTPQDIKDVSDTDYRKNIYHFILNESAVRELGWTPSQAIGHRMFLDGKRAGYVKAIVKNFNFESLHHAIKPLILFPDLGGSNLLVKLGAHHIPESIAFLESQWKKLVPYRPFEYKFMDDDFNQLYSSDLRLGKAMSLFTGIAIALACMGLLGLSSYTVKLRAKEVGVRKVLGASVTNVTVLLTTDFIKPVLIATIVAAPLAWLAMNNWLDSFAYRTEISVGLIIAAAFAVIFLATLSVSFQTIKTSRINPVKSLRGD